MSRSKHHSCSISQILTIGLLSFCATLVVSVLSYWLVMLRLLKYIFKRKENKEEAKETPHPPITNMGESPVSSPKTKPEPQPVTTQVEPEPQPIATKVEPEPQPIATKVEPEPQPIATKVEPEPQTVATKVEAEGDVLAMEVAEAYCVKCRQKRSIQGAKKVITQKGRHAMEGTCPLCGTKLFRFIAREKEKNSG